MWRVLILLPFLLSLVLEPRMLSWVYASSCGGMWLVLIGLIALVSSMLLGISSYANWRAPALRGCSQKCGVYAALLALGSFASQAIEASHSARTIPGSFAVWSVPAYTVLVLVDYRSSWQRLKDRLVVASAVVSVLITYAISRQHGDIRFWLWETSSGLSSLLHGLLCCFVVSCVLFVGPSPARVRRLEACSIAVISVAGVLALSPFLLMVPFSGGSDAVAKLIIVPYVSCFMLLFTLKETIWPRASE